MTVTGNNTKVLRNGDPEPPLKEGTARIYSMRFCPWAERVVLYASAKGIDVEIVNIDLQNKPEWYFKKHYQGKVPSFEKDGKVVIESGIIPEYLDGIYPTNPILPTDPFLRAQQRTILEKISGLPTAFYGAASIVREKLEGEAKTAKVKPLEEALDVAEKELSQQFFGGSSPGYADYMVLPFYERLTALSPVAALPNQFPSPRWPKLSAWFTALTAHPSIQSVLIPIETQRGFFTGYLEGKPNYDHGI